MRLPRFLARTALVLAVLVVAGATWQTLAERSDRRRLPPVGRFVEVQGRAVHVVEMGAGHPGPVVVLECGIGGATAASWGQLEPQVARFARVIAYDRAGMGLSDPSPSAREALALTTELHQLLDALQVPRPVVLVGHSYGGLLARVYTARWPDEVAGLALVESSHPDQFGGSRAARSRLVGLARAMPILSVAARLGIVRAVLAFIPTAIRTLPPESRDRQLSFMAASRQWDGIVRELQGWDSTNAEVRAMSRTLGDRPLRVLTSGRTTRTWDRWRSLQDELPRLSTRGEHRVIAEAGHATLIEDARYAPAVAAAVREVVDAVRAGRAAAAAR